MQQQGMAMDSAAWGIIGAAVGALASIGTTWIAARNAQKLQSQKAVHDRLDRFNGFQRETLLDLQNSIHDALRLASRAHLEDCEALRNGKTWSAIRLSPELDEALRLAHRKVAILIERVANDQLRHDVKALMVQVNTASAARSLQESTDALQLAYHRTDKALTDLGATLRGLY